MDWTNILILVIGGAIGIVTNYFTNHYQLQRWREERNEQRREAKIQLAIELTRTKIESIKQGIYDVVMSLESDGLYRNQRDAGLLTDEEFQEWMLKTINNENSTYNKKMIETNTIAEILSYTISDEFEKEYKRFFELVRECGRLTLDTRVPRLDEFVNTYDELSLSAATLCTMLDDKLISIRDSE